MSVGDSEQPLVSIVFPAYNEQEAIGDAVAEAEAVLQELGGKHEILVCDDGSRDDTLTVLRALEEKHPMLRVFSHPENWGISAAQRTLVSAARGRYIFHIGADGQWPMRELVPMLGKLEAGADLVIGVRREKRYSWTRRFVSTCYNGLVAALWGRHFGDLGSVRMARASLWKQIPFHSQSAFINAQRILIAYYNGAKIETVPVEHRARATGASKFASPLASLAATKDLIAFRLSPRSRYQLKDWRSS